MRFPFDDDVKEIGRIFKKHGFSIYLVGGAVRDFLLSEKIHDMDFATDAKPEEIKGMFSRTIDTGIKHGTVTILFRKKGYEVTTFRTDGEYKDSRHPENVKFIKDLESDLVRREITINALAADIDDGKIIDLVGGRKDLKRKIIRAIGNPDERFTEDALRILRAARFSAKLDFEIEKETFDSMKKLSESVNKVSAERIKEEFYRLVGGKNPIRGIEYMRSSGLLKVLLPELDATIGVEQGGMHKTDVYTHLLRTLYFAVKYEHPFPVRMAALFHDVGKPQAREKDATGRREYTFYRHDEISAGIFSRIALRLKTSNEERESVSNLIRHHMFAYSPEWTDGAVRRFIKKVGKENINDLIDLRVDDEDAIKGAECDRRNLIDLIERVKAEEEKGLLLTLKDLEINGNDLIKEKIASPGPEIGRILNALFEEVIETPSFNRKDHLLERARELSGKAQ